MIQMNPEIEYIVVIQNSRWSVKDGNWNGISVWCLHPLAGHMQVKTKNKHVKENSDILYILKFKNEFFYISQRGKF